MKTHIRHRSEALGDTLCITIPSLKKWRTMIITIGELALASVIGCFLFLVVATSGSIMDRWGHAGQVALILMLIIPAIGVILLVIGLVAELLWQLFGQENIEVAPDSIAIRKAILGIGRSKVYSAEHISQMRSDAAGAVEPYAVHSDGKVELFDKGTGVIAFDYKGKTIRMGIGVDPFDAKKLVAEILRRYPQYT